METKRCVCGEELMNGGDICFMGHYQNAKVKNKNIFSLIVFLIASLLLLCGILIDKTNIVLQSIFFLLAAIYMKIIDE